MSVTFENEWMQGLDSQEKYQRYLASREWNVLKELVAMRSRRICERCKHNPMDHVHHLTYARKYHEALDDLQAICKGCHDFTHAKSDFDPLSTAPVMFQNREIRNVYLAGKISGQLWRDDIVGQHQWSSENHGLLPNALSGDDLSLYWETVDNAIPLPDGKRSLGMTGPWWVPVNGFGGHDTVGGNPFAHAGSKFYADTSCNVWRAVQRCDLLFAWIDTLDCYGTILEIGLASSLRKLVVIGTPSNFDHRELWLAFQVACAVISVDPSEKTPAKVAWDRIWSLPYAASENDAHRRELALA